MKTPFKVGRFTVAIGLVAFGLGLLFDNLGMYTGATSTVTKLWPLLLIGFGVEYLVHTILSQRSGEEKRIRWDVGGAFLLTFIVLLSAGITAFRTYVVPNGGSIGFGPSESRTETVSAPLGAARELVADVKVGTVSLRPNVNGNEVKVDATYTTNGLLFDRDEMRRQLEQIKLEVKEGDVIRISADAPTRLNNISVQYVVYAPEGLKVRAQTGTGQVDVTGYKGDLVLSSNLGRIQVNASRGSLNVNGGSGYIGVQDFQGPIDARTNLGSIVVNNVTGSLQLESRTGSIAVNGYQGGNLTAETGTGRVDVNSTVPLAGNVSLKTQTGSITLTVPKESSVRATAQTNTGSLTVPAYMSTNRQGTASYASGSSGDGKYTVTLEAGTGPVNFLTR